ncbi:heterokaryon incompatibility protein-domain-containing protein [Diaporthe sp. PMI_573]|nr:heterokaryon incompatibility protein-domain-containing protein [Diaporthaceae sp. PMI_573]
MAASSRTQFVNPSITFPRIDPSSQIRLLHLASSGEHPITCQLSVASLDDPPPYEALSYVWGDTEDLRVIQVDGHDFRVTQNLHAALISLVPLDADVRVLWIDAICINQGTGPADLAERGQQVRRMSRIFSDATNVVAYLGEPYPWLSEAIEFLTVAAGGQQQHVDRITERVDYNVTEVHGALVTFVNRPWWNRVWTVQEAVVGRQVSFQFGRLEISFDMIICAIDNIVQLKIRGPFKFAELDPASGENLITGFLKMKMVSLPFTEASLVLALFSFQNRDSGDPRDKIYSLMGLFPSSHHVVDLDYTIPPKQLFEDFTLAWIQKTQDLTVLGHLHDPELRIYKNMSSFAVDWSYRPSTPTILTLQSRIILQGQAFDACKGFKALWHRNSTGQVSANGFVFDSIKAVGAKNVPRFSSSWNLRFRALQGIVDLAHVMMGGNDPKQTETLLTIWHTLCMDCTQDAGVFTRLRGKDDEKLLETWWDVVFKPSPPPFAIRLVDQARPINTTVSSASLERSFVFTENGRMGLAPSWCKVGDAIAIMAGGIVPIVLRPAGEVSGQEGAAIPVFEVVGEAYVHGVMDGQAFAASGRAEGEFDDIYLV